MNFWMDVYTFWLQAGWFVWPLFLLAVVSWSWLSTLFFKLNSRRFRSSRYEREVSRRIAQGCKSKDIVTWMMRQKGIVPRLVSYVFRGNSKDQHSVISRYREASESEVNCIRNELVVLSALVKAAPLLGLLGTVAGMIETFAGLDAVEGMEGITAGLAKALLTTQLGLLIALPGIFGLGLLRRKLDRFILELNRFRLQINSLCPEKM